MNTISSNNSSSPVSELKHLTLSIDQGITADVNRRIIKVTDSLSKQWQHDKMLSTLVKMVRALSDYAASKKGDIHEGTASLIYSIVNQIENLSISPGVNLPIAKKQSILSKEIAKYNKFKQQIKSTPREDISKEREKSDMDKEVISDLKSIILSLDWEITDEIIHRLDREIQRLQTHWQNSKVHLSFLQMFKSIGNYVLNKGSDTHPDSISLLHSLYRNFEHIVLTPSMTVADQKEILLREMKKFNDLKKTISSSKAPKKPQALSPMDDLIGTKVSNLSPVDDLIEEIHMLQDSGTSTHSLDASTVPRGHAANAEIKEVIPNRLKKQPIPEIQARLDAFFDEDEPLSELAFADSGEAVVPYKGDTTQSAPSFPEQEISSKGYDSSAEMDGPIFEDDSVSNGDGISFEDDSATDQDEISFEEISPSELDSPPFKEAPSSDDNQFRDQPVIEKSPLVTDGMVPYDFEDEFFEEDVESPPAMANERDATNMLNAAKQQSIASDEDDIKISEEDLNIAEEDGQIEVDIQISDDMESSAEMVLLEELKATVAKCMFHGGTREIELIHEQITALEELWKSEPERLIMLKMVKSLTGYFDLLSFEPDDQTLELMLYIVESMESSSLKSSDAGDGERSEKIDLIGIFSRYIDFQSTVVDRVPSARANSKASEKQLTIEPSGQTDISEKTVQPDDNYSENKRYKDRFNQPETLADKEIFYENSAEDISKINESRGFWSKIKRFLGF